MEGNENNNAQNATGQTNQMPTIDYDKIQKMIDGRNEKTENSVLKDYFTKQGLSEKEMQTAINDYKTQKENKAKEEVENSQTLQKENADLKAKVLQMQINEIAKQNALEIGVDLKAIPYLIKMADLDTAVNEKGEIVKENVTKALTKVLEDLPQLKKQEMQNNGFSKIGSDNNNEQTNMNDVLKNIFSN